MDRMDDYQAIYRGPVAGLAWLRANLCVQSDTREQWAGRFLIISYPAAERHANVLCEADRYWFIAPRQM